VASLFPWPAAVVSAAERSGDHHDQIVACLLYAGVGFLVPLAFIAIYTHLARRPILLTDPAEATYALTNRRRAMLSIVGYPVSAILAFVSPDLALALFVAIPLAFVLSVFQQEPVPDSYDAAVDRS
jgi:uncharacterized membrane protein